MGSQPAASSSAAPSTGFAGPPSPKNAPDIFGEDADGFEEDSEPDLAQDEAAGIDPADEFDDIMWPAAEEAPPDQQPASASHTEDLPPCLATGPVDRACCLARLYRGGRLNQCMNAGTGPGGLCATHVKPNMLEHGIVTEALPHKTLQRIREAELRKARPRRRPLRWYSYDQMYRSVEALFPKRLMEEIHCLHGRVRTKKEMAEETEDGPKDLDPNQLVKGLLPFEIQRALDRTHMIIRDHHEMRCKLKIDAGPATAEEFLLSDGRRSYNGPRGGERFQWYCPQIFLRELVALGYGDKDRHTCTEHEAMEALHSTNVRLKARHFTAERMLPYAGPQCYPQLLCTARSDKGEDCFQRAEWLPQFLWDSRNPYKGKYEKDLRIVPCSGCRRFYANSTDVQHLKQDTGEAIVRTARTDTRATWLSCDSCGKSRLVAYDSLESLLHKPFHESGGQERKWESWLSEEEVRLRCLAWQSLREEPQGSSLDAKFESERSDSEEGSVREDPGDSSSNADSGDDGLDYSTRAQLDLALAGLGARARTSAKEVHVREQLARRAGSYHCAPRPAMDTATTTAAEGKEAPGQAGWFAADGEEVDAVSDTDVQWHVRRASRRRDFFRCDMLQQCVPPKPGEQQPKWRTMSCDADGDDYLGLIRSGNVLQQLQVEDRLWILSPDLNHALRNEGAAPYCREAVVKDVYAAKEGDALVEAHVVADVFEWCAEGPPSKVQFPSVQFRLQRCGEEDGPRRWTVHWKTNDRHGREDLTQHGVRANVRAKVEQYASPKGLVSKLDPNFQKDHLPEEVVLVPETMLNTRVAKFNTVLKENSLWAVRAMHEILDNMVLFSCKICREEFPAFHPAFEPPEFLDMELLKPGLKGTAPCDVRVASWDEPPALFHPYSLEVASAQTGQGASEQKRAQPLPRPVQAVRHTGRCLRCQKDIDRQLQQNGGDEASVVPRFSYMNNMDPCWKFPHEELRDLFMQCTLTEAMLLALEHLQVSFVTIERTRLHKFRKNVISFPQESGSFFARMGALRQYRIDERVNSIRGPPSTEADDDEALLRSPRLAKHATEEERNLFAEAPSGHLIYPATIKDITADGRLLLEYTDSTGRVFGRRGLESPQWVTARVQMPWHPSHLNEVLIIMLRRSVGHGRVLEGLEVRWGLVVKVLQALTRLGPWRGGGVLGPMHKWYDPRLFDVLDEEQVRATHAPKVWRGELVSEARIASLTAEGETVDAVDARTAAELEAAGFAVRVDGEDVEANTDEGASAIEIEQDVFRRWLEVREFRLGSALGAWWANAPVHGPDDVGQVLMKMEPDDTTHDFSDRIARHAGTAAGEAKEKLKALGTPDEELLEEAAWERSGLSALQRRALLDNGRLTIPFLVLWCQGQVGLTAFEAEESGLNYAIEDELEMELRVAAEHFSGSTSRGCMEAAPESDDVEAQSRRLAESLAAPEEPWPRVSDVPTPFRARGRFSKALPLSFPMGIADMYDQRLLDDVSGAQWVQHMLRHSSGMCVQGLRGHREVWAFVNTLLLEEAYGKGFAVQRNVMRRIGGRVVGHKITTKAQLREMIEDEQAVRTLVHQLMSVGRDVRSTPMQWAYEGKKTTCAVHHMSWRPPWVRPRDAPDQEDPRLRFIGLNEVVEDSVGLGRIPMFWWTQNCAYNSAFDIHRFNTTSPNAVEALTDPEDIFKQVRYNFIRDRPDLAAYIVALRAELNMRIVMPTVVSHSSGVPYFAVQRFECGKGGNPHFHGASYGEGNPLLDLLWCDEKPLPESDGEPEAPNDDESAGEEQLNDGEVEGPPPPLASSSAEVAPPPAPHPAHRPKKEKRILGGSNTADILTEELPVPSRLLDEVPSDAALDAKTKEFFEFFRQRVSEWNPCFTADGEQRVLFFWDEVVGAHDVAVPDTAERVQSVPGMDHTEPSRVRLSEILAEALHPSNPGVDLRKVRHLVAALVQKYGRHDRHAKTGPVLNKHPCARGKPECPYCRYGFPHSRRSWAEGMSLEKGDREGQWSAKFPRNDGLVCSHEPHVMLANMGNIDWRPCLNLWAVVHYICKYATKSPEGSKTLGETLRCAVDEVCKYTATGEPVDFLGKSLQKFYSRTLGDRDYTIFEAMFLGLRLPLMFSLLPVVSLNTTGTRALKSSAVMSKAGPDDEIAYSSKIDRFDERLGLLRKQYPRPEQDALRQYWEHLVRDTSLYEFCWKYSTRSSKIAKMTQDVCLMVTPALCASSACVSHDRHEIFARTCVIAYWRCISSQGRLDLWHKMRIKDPRLFGGTVLQAPAPLAGSRPSDLDRFVGIRDLVAAFDGPKSCANLLVESPPDSRRFKLKRRNFSAKPYGWAYALMEMLVDPVLYEWIPQYVVEQYRRWNPYFVESLRRALKCTKPSESNHKFLFCVRAEMDRLEAKKKGEEEQAREEQGAVESGSDSDCNSSDAGADQDEACQLEDHTSAAIVNDSLPSFGADGPDDVATGADWAKATAEEQLSAAGPAESLPQRPQPSRASSASGYAGQVNPEGYNWEAANFTSRSKAQRLDELWRQWCGRDVFSADDLQGIVDEDDVTDGQVGGADKLDPWQEFARDIIARTSGPSASSPLRLILTGTAGTGKSRTVKAAVKARIRRAVKGKFDGKQKRRVCVLAAPTGCASFQLKHGATTIHRAFGVPVGFCGRAKNKHTEAFVRRQTRLRNAEVFIIDEYSMVGRQMLGKVLYKARECLPGIKSMGGKDVVLAGDAKQAAPIGDEPMFRVGAYRGKGLNKPRRGEAAEDAPTLPELTRQGELFREEFQDVVILRKVHRIDKSASSGMDAASAARFEEDADEFLTVTNGMANCTWTPRDHAWLALRNRSALAKTQEGQKELEEFTEAPLLMDGKRQNQKGEDGSTKINEQELFKLAERTGKPVLSIAAKHGGYEEGSRPELLFDEDFKGLQSNFLVCEGARVLLTSNLWPEAGLMNGALGTVRGFIWPAGGDPRSQQKDLQAPLCIIVEFDDVDLGEEPAQDARGRPITEDGRITYRRVCFFPELLETFGVDAKGVPRACRLVPIFLSKTIAESDTNVSRHQFPLVLAWALTHWKAQGMTLRRARIRMGTRTASQPGIGFVAITRVKHPWHVVFDTDLPSWEHFQEAQWKTNFRARRRFEWRLEAKASRTLRKYGSCSADPWDPADARIAEALLEGLREKAAERRRDMGLGSDPDAFCWQREEVPVEALLLKQTQQLAQKGEASQEKAEAVAQRLNGPWHRPAVLEALGCLIPGAFHPRHDGKKPRGKAVRQQGLTVQLQAGTWKVDAFEEQALTGLAPGAEARLMKGVAEFFLIALRRVCDRLALPTVLATVRLGSDLQSVQTEEEMQLLLLTMKSWEHWDKMVESTASAQSFQILVPLDDAKLLRDCVAVVVSSTDPMQRLGKAGSYDMHVYDPVGRQALAERLSRNVGKLLSTSGSQVNLKVHTMAAGTSPFERGFAALGVLIHNIMHQAGRTYHDLQEPDFVAKAQSSLGNCFSVLRSEADKSGDRDVLHQLLTDTGCWLLLDALSAQRAVEPTPVPVDVLQPTAAKVVEVTSFQPLKILTWNIRGRDKSSLAPKAFTVEDKMVAVQLEICSRWKPDLFALQECVSQEPLPQFAGKYRLVGAAPSEHCGFLHSYVKQDMAAELLPTPDECPAVLSRISFSDGSTIDVAAVHMMPGISNRTARISQFHAALSGMRPGSQIIMGDLNVRPEEAPPLLKAGGFTDAEYAGRSWHPSKTQFDADKELQKKSGPGFAFDRIFFKGALWLESGLVGQGRVFSEGVHFSLSDHSAVLGFLDVHPSHRIAAPGSEVRRDRRAALVATRDHALLEERCIVTEMSRSARQEAAQQWARTDAKQQAEAVRAQRAQIKERKVQRDALWEAAFGKSSFFRGDDRPKQSPARAADFFRIAPARGGPGKPKALPMGERSSPANALAQVLVWVPKAAAFLQHHRGPGDKPACSSSCPSCSLAEWRVSCREEHAHAFQSLKAFSSVGSLLGNVRELLAAMSRHETDTNAWDGLDAPLACRATAVDAVFAFVEEVRLRCGSCGNLVISNEQGTVLDLPVPGRTSTRHSIADLYLERCAPQEQCSERVCMSQRCNGAVTDHTCQKRLLHLPQVLFVSIGRDSRPGINSRYPVDVDEYVALPGCGNAELAAVLYKDAHGPTPKKNPYRCMVRSSGSLFWFFEDGRPPRAIQSDISGLCRHTVELLVYVPTAALIAPGAAFQQHLQALPATGRGSHRIHTAGTAISRAPTAPPSTFPDPPKRRSDSPGHGVEGPQRKRSATQQPSADRPQREQRSGVVRMQDDNPLWHLLELHALRPRPPTMGDDSSHPPPGKKQRNVIQHTPLWRKLADSHHIPGDVVQAVLAGFQHRFGEEAAYKLASERWLCDLENWRNLKKEVQRLCPDPGAQVLPLVVAPVAEAIFAVARLILHQRDLHIDVDKTDRQALNELRASGWQWREAATWGENDCLADSLLQILLSLRVVVPEDSAGDIAGQRRTACQAARQHLLQFPHLLPRDPYGRPQWDEYLQHHRHAEALVRFFLQHFPAGPAPVPRSGFTLVVHARYDTGRLPPDRMELRLPGAFAPGLPLQLHVFNWTGAGLDGYHYDALLQPSAAVDRGLVVSDDDDVGGAAPSSAVAAPLLKRLKNDGKGRATQQPPMLPDAGSPSPVREQPSASGGDLAATGASPKPKASAKSKQSRQPAKAKPKGRRR